MKNSCRYSILFALLPLNPFCESIGRYSKRALACIFVAVLWAAMARASGQTLPTDAQSTCQVPVPMFNGWFKEGMASLNGTVNPANSVTFSNPANNCAFYQWSEQMFLWITSPAPENYGGTVGDRVFESPVFFDVSVPDANLQRTFIKHEPGKPRKLKVRAAKVGPNRLPVIMDKRGRMFEIERPQVAPSGKLLILNQQNKPVEVDRVTLEKGNPIFRDKNDKVIAKPKAIVRPELSKAAVVQKFMVERKALYLDREGNVIDTEEGQADFSVLLAQNGSLVYYVTMVNDVYAYFLTGIKSGGITPMPLRFPTTKEDLDKIVTFAASYGVRFPDPNALAIEVKTSWVEAALLPNPGNYITMDAIIPTYDKTNPLHWTPEASGEKKVQLALVGMHVVGSTNGHPEMIWATFEHFGNAPNATYQYNSTDGKTKTVSQDTSGTWLFAASNSAGPFNLAHMDFLDDPNIEAVASPDNPKKAPPPFTISASDTMRMKPFGAASDVAPNGLDANSAASNTEVIAINNSVLRQLPKEDVRANYYMIGATWTIGGASPTGPFNRPTPGPSGSATPTPVPGSGNEVGTSQLANTTMETYQQGPGTTWGKGVNCFACHGPRNTTDISHVFIPLQPLPSPSDKTKAAPKKP